MLVKTNSTVESFCKEEYFSFKVLLNIFNNRSLWNGFITNTKIINATETRQLKFFNGFQIIKLKKEGYHWKKRYLGSRWSMESIEFPSPRNTVEFHPKLKETFPSEKEN